MAINKNHEFEELNGVKCGIVERNASEARCAFLRSILERNGYEVVVVPSPPPKGAPAPAEGETTSPPTSFTIGVTDYTFNAINAIFGRLLKDTNGQFVTWAYWNQETSVNDDTTPYYLAANS